MRFCVIRARRLCTLAYLGRHCVRLADLVTPVSPSHRNDGHLCKYDGTADGSGNLQAGREQDYVSGSDL